MLVTNVINMGVMVLLARKLSPADFGLAALAYVLFRFLSILASEGASQYVIYDNQPGREERVQAAFWMDLSCSIAATLLGLSAISVVTRFYTEPGLGAVLFVLLLRFPVDSLCKVPDALIKKSLDFKKLEIRDGILELLTALISVAMALTGWGVWSLILPGIIASPVRAFIVFRISRWRPRLVFHFRLWPRIFSYSANVMGSTLMNYIITEGDTLLIGKFMGSYSLGIYNLAWQSANLVGRTIVNLSNKITLPVFSTISDNVQYLQDGLRRIFRILAVATFPILIGMFVVADNFIVTVYGVQWVQAVLPLRILIIYALRYAIGSPTGSVYKAIGRPDINFKLMLAITPFYLLSIWIGSTYGLIGVAVGVTLVRTVFGFIDFTIVARCLNQKLIQVIQPVVPAFIASCLMGAIVFIIKSLVNRGFPGGNLSELVVLVSLGALIYLGLIRNYFHGLAHDIVQITNPLLGSFNIFVGKLLKA